MRAFKAVDRTAEGATATAARITAAEGTTEADAKTTAEAATMAAEVATMPQPAERGTGARFSSGLAQGPTRSRLAWADNAQASGLGRGITYHWPRLGRVGHVGRQKRSLLARALSS